MGEVTTIKSRLSKVPATRERQLTLLLRLAHRDEPVPIRGDLEHAKTSIFTDRIGYDRAYSALQGLVGAGLVRSIVASRPMRYEITGPGREELRRA